MNGEEIQGDGVIEDDGLVRFRVCGTWLAASACHIETIGVLDSVSPLPMAPKHVLGQTRLHDEVFVVFDMAAFLSMKDALDSALVVSDPPRVVVLKALGMRAAVPVGATSHMVNMPKEDLDPPDVLNNGRLGDFLSGEFESELGRVGVLDVERLLESARV